MPPKFVTTVRQLIYWEYAHLIARAAGFEDNFGFIVSRYKKFVSGDMTWSSSVRDYEKELDRGRACTYCGATVGLSTDHIIPSSRVGVDPRIAALLDSSDNCVCACRRCNSSKGDRDVFEWYRTERIEEIPRLVLSKFLKLAYHIHETQGTLDLKDPNMDGVLDIYDLRVVITHLITKIADKAQQKSTPQTSRGSPSKKPGV
jgi:hypothetical protein